MQTQGDAVGAQSQSDVDVRFDLSDARELVVLATLDGVQIRAAQGRRNLWLIFRSAGIDSLALRIGPNVGEIVTVQHWTKSDGTTGFDFVTPLGAMRAEIGFPVAGKPIVRCTSSLIPSADTAITFWPRDLYALGRDAGTVHTAQRGLRTGTVFGSASSPTPFTFFYLQNFSSLNDYFTATKRPPANTVAASWPEFGYAPPAAPDCVLPKARETVISNAYVSFEPGETLGDRAAGQFLDTLADIYLALDRPDVGYHDWPARAEATLRDLTLSPACTYVRQGRRYLMPYVADTAKPPESMVQFTVAVNVGEYDRWRGETSLLGNTLSNSVQTFYNDHLDTVVRWLPGEDFDQSQAEENMNHRAMDSWYLCHALFNVFRIGEEGDAKARGIFKQSLPYLMRVAHRFDYRWPIFFDLESLDIIRAEAEPGRGGETDVAGLYALVMLHAYEAFGVREYLEEAEQALARLHGLGFNLAYQLNTTGFAAEAAMRLWKLTKKRQYLELSEVCMANIFDNMWIWRCDYGNGWQYRTFFGLFPLRDAPYLAPYEELEAHAKFHEYLALGGDDVRPSLRLLIAEFQKYGLDRAWYFYPDALPLDSIAGKSRNGRIVRQLSVPLEDLEDGFATSGQVGQELYGAGLPFVLTARHYMNLPAGLVAYCNYPMYDFALDEAGRATWRAGGDPRGTCELRVMPRDATARPAAVSVWTSAGEVRYALRGRVSPEGHAVFAVRGGQRVEIEYAEAARPGDVSHVVIGALATNG
ncbi:MAG: hypothetical protein NVSMB64_11640 [Candidatus Velthaea sp.]